MFKKLLNLLRGNEHINTAAPDRVPAQSKSCISVSMNFEEYDTIEVVADGYTFIPVELDGYVSPSGGYLNYAIFKVAGINPKTGRKNTRTYQARDAAGAVQQAVADGFGNPQAAEIVLHDPPTEKQIDYLHSYGVPVPKSACKGDISAMLNRLKYDGYPQVAKQEKIDETTIKMWIIPKVAVNNELAIFAHKMGFRFSKFIGMDDCLSMLVNGLSARDKAAFYAYAVYLSITGGTLENLLEHPRRADFYKFADAAMQDERIRKSILGRNTVDFQAPNKNTLAYKEAIKYLTK